MCDDLWGHIEATVVCRQLGYDTKGYKEVYKSLMIRNLWVSLAITGAVAFSNAHFGAGTGPIRKFDCNGRESRLTDCSSSACQRYHQYLGYVSAPHTDDAGVRCQGSIVLLDL